MNQKQQMFYFETCPSTMDVAKSFAEKIDLQKKSFFIVTKKQTQGRGRLGRVWTQASVEHDIIGTAKASIPSIDESFDSFHNLYKTQDDFLPFTFALSTRDLRVPIEWVSLLVGAALYDSFLSISNFILKDLLNISKESKPDLDLLLKWPNDLMWKDNNSYQKISGILCEAQVTPSSSLNASDHPINSISHIFIGVGMNFFTHPTVNTSAAFFDCLFNSLKDSKTEKDIKNSYKYLLSSSMRKTILQRFGAVLQRKLYDYLCKQKDLNQIKKSVLKRLFPIGTYLEVKEKGRGRFIGLNDSGALLLKKDVHDEGCSDNTLDVSEKIETIYSSDSIKMIDEHKNLICIDFGNTRIHMTGKNNKNQQKHINISYTNIKTLTSEDLKVILSLFNTKTSTNINIVYVSVNSKSVTENALKSILKVIKNEFLSEKITLQRVTEAQIFRNFDIQKTFDYKTLGADRALKCVFAFQKSQELQKNVLVFSLGTATTCEGFSKDGLMIENFVSPGIQMSFDALHHFTALLPKLNAQKISIDSKQNFWTQNTYLKRGIILSLIGTIEKISKLHAPCTVVLTGGDSKNIQKLFYKFLDKDEISKFDIQVLENIETKILIDFHEQFK